MPDFIPRRDQQAAAWAARFTSCVVENAERYSVPIETVNQLLAKETAFADAIKLALAPATRTSGTIVLKDNARSDFQKTARQVADLLRANPSISAAAYIAFGIKGNTRGCGKKHRISAPTTAPQIDVLAVHGNFVDIAITNPEFPSKRGLARNVRSIMIFTGIGDVEPMALEEWRMHSMTAHTSVTVAFPPGTAPGTKVWITARFIGTRAQPGPLARTVYEHLGLSTAVPDESPKPAVFRTRKAA